MDRVLIIKDVKKTYSNKSMDVIALKSIDLEVENEDIICIMGPSGSGKTTLLKVSASFLEPDHGYVNLLGYEIYRVPFRKRMEIRRRYIGFMFQEDLLINSLTVYENVELPLLILGLSKGVRRDMVEKALNRIGAYGLKDRKPDEVSGGERRRVSLARSIVNDPEILFVDEPTSNLDTDSALQIIRELKTLNEEGKTIIASTHDPLMAKHMGSIIYIRDGELKNSP